MYNINIVSDLRTIYHDTNSMIFFTSAEMHISTRALLVEYGPMEKLVTEQIFYFKTKSDLIVALDFPQVGFDLFI